MARALIKQADMRSLVLAFLFFGCGPHYEDDIAVPLSDAKDKDCYIGNFRIVAPVANLHYAPSMEVYIDTFELSGDPVLTMVDDHGQSYLWTNNSFGPDPTLSGTRERYHYDLAPSERYTLTATHCRGTQTVTFFTSPP